MKELSFATTFHPNFLGSRYKTGERAWLAHFGVGLAFINDVRTFLSTDNENVKRTAENIHLLKKQFENDEFQQAA